MTYLRHKPYLLLCDFSPARPAAKNPAQTPAQAPAKAQS